MFRVDPVKLHDCQIHGPGSGSELFVVEGDSASKNVARVCNPRFQAVLPMQGKPLNAWKASKPIVTRNGLYQRLIQAIGTGWDDAFDLGRCRYDRIIFLFDPDADGIHCGALMLMFFFRWMPEIIDSSRLLAVRPPLYELSSIQRRPNDPIDRIHAYSDEQFHKIRQQLRAKQVPFQSQRYRGLASISAAALSTTCIDPTTRQAIKMTRQDAAAAVQIFGGRK